MFFDSSKTRRGAFVAVLVAASAVSLCRAAGPAVPQVMATTSVVADLVRQVGGDRVAVECLMGAGIDPHSYRATPRDADRLSRARLVVASGLHLEGKIADLLTRLSRRTLFEAPTVARLAPALERGFGERVTRLAAAGRLLDSLSHKSALQRGFALVRRPDGGLVRAATGLEIGEAVTLVFHDGEASAAITGSTPAGAGGGSGPKKRRKGEDGGDQGALF
jgi:hypothetical protein